MSEFVVKEKTMHEMLSLSLSLQLAHAITARPNHCAANAWRALISFPDLFRVGGRLVEGWLVIETENRVVMNEHVWCELANGRIVDPSVVLLVPSTTPVFYFAGVSRRWEETEALEGEFFPHVRFEGYGDDGLGHPGYRAAREAARHKVYTLALAQQPLKALQFFTVQPDHSSERLLANPGDEEAGLIVEGAPLDLALSLMTARALPAVGERCWQNARAALLRMPDRFFTALYTEGWLVGQWADAIRVMEHGWVETRRAGIVDPTLVLGNLPRRLLYLPGLQCSWQEMLAEARSPLPLARRRGQGGAFLAYREACRLALVRGEALAWETGLPLLPMPGIVTMIQQAGTGEVLLVGEVAWDFPVPSTPSPCSTVLIRHLQHPQPPFPHHPNEQPSTGETHA